MRTVRWKDLMTRVSVKTTVGHLVAFAPPDARPSARGGAGFDGTSHANVASISYLGTNDGGIGVTEPGNGGSDESSADIVMKTGSTGTVGTSTDQSLIKGGKGLRDRSCLALLH